VDDVSLEVSPGQLAVISGASGSGKSTLLFILGLLLRPERGVVTLNGADAWAQPARGRAALRAREIGFIFQEFHLIPYLNAVDNVRAAALGFETDDETAKRDASARVMLVELGLEERLHHRPGKLSAGEQQRVALARAFYGTPSMILADEPTGNLDRENSELVLDRLRDYTREGNMVVVVSHDEKTQEFADIRFEMTAGRLKRAGGSSS